MNHACPHLNIEDNVTILSFQTEHASSSNNIKSVSYSVPLPFRRYEYMQRGQSSNKWQFPHLASGEEKGTSSACSYVEIPVS
jgi:hypothetical protein